MHSYSFIPEKLLTQVNLFSYAFTRFLDPGKKIHAKQGFID